MQKCWNDNWRAPEVRKSLQDNARADSTNIDGLGPIQAMPQLNNNGLLI